MLNDIRPNSLRKMRVRTSKIRAVSSLNRDPLPAIRRRALAHTIRHRHLGGHIRRSGQEDDLAVRALGHGLHSLQVADLHRGRRGQDVSGLAHEFRGLDFGAGGDDLGFSDSLRLRGHGQRVLQLVGENHVFDQHTLDLDTPPGGDVFDDLADGLGDLFAALDDVLEDAGADDVTQGRLGALDQRLAHVGDAEGGLVGGGDVVVDYGGEVQGYVVLGHADLLGDLCGGVNKLYSQELDIPAGEPRYMEDVPTIWILTSTWINLSLSGLILTSPGSTAR